MDWDEDGDLDLLVGEREGFLNLFINSGSATNPVLDAGVRIQDGGVDLDVGENSSPLPFDWNNDGKKDLLMGTDEDGILLYLNVGTNEAPEFNGHTVVISYSAWENWRNRPRIHDFNQDGLFDIITGCESGTITFYENEGTLNNPAFSNNFTNFTYEDGTDIDIEYRNYVDAFDWDQDGFMDVIFGSVSGPTYFIRQLPFAEPGAPAAPSDLVLTPYAGGALEATITWTCPTTQVNGDPLTDLDEMRVYRDDVLIYTDNAPVIGGPGMYVDNEVPASGLYTYKVVGFNDFGEGLPASGTTWVGEDVPNFVENLDLVEQSGNGYLTWDNPTTGLNGGAFNEPILGYDIVRLPDNVTFEIAGIATDFLDTTISSAGFYFYEVTAYNSIGDGGTATSNIAMIGAGEEIFLDDFEAGIGNWNVIINSGQGMWTIYAPPYPNNYQMPPTSSGNVCSADSDETGSGTTTNTTLELMTPLNMSTYETVNLHFDNDFNVIAADDAGYIDVSNDGGTTWNNVLTWIGTDVTATNEIIDITAYAAFQPSVIVRFISVQPGWDWWWTIDNVGIYGTAVPNPFDPPENVSVNPSTGLMTWDPPGGAIFFDDFESYNAGEYLAVQSDDWTTWSGTAGGADDAYVSDEQAYSGVNSVKIEGASSDIVHLMGNLTTGAYEVSHYMYIEPGYGGYYNLLHEFTGDRARTEWAIEIYFGSDGTGFIHAGGSNAATFTYPPGTWFECSALIDLDNDWAEYWVDGVFVHEWQWSLQSGGGAGMNMLGAIDLFAAAPAGEAVMFYFDDFEHAVGNAEPSDELTGYNIYLDDMNDPIDYTTELQYQFTALIIGEQYLAGVSAVYDDPGESDIVEFPFTFSGSEAGDIVIAATKLGNNYPNPFNPETAINFALKEAGKVRIDVYNIKGQLVKTLVNDHLEAKYHSVIWDGKDNNGVNVSSGVYFYKMDAGKYTSTKKMILMK